MYKWEEDIIMDRKVIGFEGIDWFILSRVLVKDFSENSGSIKPLDFLTDGSCRFFQDSFPFCNIIYIISVSYIRFTKRQTILSKSGNHSFVHTNTSLSMRGAFRGSEG
jgi:hypothetical protein